VDAEEELEDHQGDGAPGPDLAPAHADIEEKAGITALEDGLDDVPAVEAGNRKEVEGEKREVKKNDDEHRREEESSAGVERIRHPDSAQDLEDQAEGEGDREVGRRAAQLVDGDGDEHRRHQEQRPDDELLEAPQLLGSREITGAPLRDPLRGSRRGSQISWGFQSTRILLSRLVVRREAPARRTRLVEGS